MMNLNAKDNIAAEAILSGVPADDAEMICQEETAQAMLNRFVDKQTKREYFNYIFARSEFYPNVNTPDKSMDKWLREMETLRRQLLHYCRRINDDNFAETSLGHVARTHHDVVRQFSKHYVVRSDGGADRPVPTATQVMNTLLAQSALDEKLKTEASIPAGVAANRKRGSRGKKNKKDDKQVGKSSGKKSEK
ncbi:hypothetical protein PHMEG_00018399 [Phytophthora megakarya]|uniref:Uncharacterized protein n=1 Tax=Phytophthora megakarya TaxID=4795 RepID=A0A225VVQ3_9STRA|nr:hypothetical protein PHMEG_00018399 [Phytophthora megakarya]